MKWRFWEPTGHGSSPEMKAAEERLQEAKKSRSEMSKLIERNRQLRQRNHLVEAVEREMRRGRRA